MISEFIQLPVLHSFDFATNVMSGIEWNKTNVLP